MNAYLYPLQPSSADTKLYLPFVTLSTQDNPKLVRQTKSAFRRTISWNKYQWYSKAYAQNTYLDHLVNPSFQGVNKLLVLSFEKEDNRTSDANYYLPKVEMKDCNVMIDGKNFFWSTKNSELKTWKF